MNKFFRMKRSVLPRKAFSILLMIALLLGAMLPFANVLPAHAATIDMSYLTLSPGSDETQLNFSWHTASRANSPAVRIWKNGGEVITFTGTASSATSSLSTMYYNRVTVTGLEPGTSYTYQLGDGNGNWSAEYTTKTGSPDSFSYLVFGDPQVSSQAYGNNWKNTLEKALALRPDLAFMASTGDNIDSVTRAQYDYFFTPSAIFSSLPLATAIGNHEGSGTTHHAFFNPPNADGAQNYWYRYGDVLFMVWNCTSGNTTGMDNFLKNAIAQNEDATWRVLNFHYDIYGQGSSHALSDGKSYRDSYAQVIDRYDIDVVFNGHDHFYSRSYPMKWSGSSSTSNTQGMQSQIQNPDGSYSIPDGGTVYFSLSSSSGQKYYDAVARQPYTAFMQPAQTNLPQFSIVDVTANSFTVTTYQLSSYTASATVTQIDTYTIFKEGIDLAGETLMSLTRTNADAVADANNQFNADSGVFAGVSNLTAWNNNEQKSIGYLGANRTPIVFNNAAAGAWQSVGSATEDAGVTVDTASAFQVKFATIGYENIRFSCSQKSTGSGPESFMLAYSIGNPAGPYTVIPNSKVEVNRASDDTYGVLQQSYVDFVLPAELANQDEVYLRVYMVDSALANRSNGNTSINDIIITGDKMGEAEPSTYTVSFNSNGGSAVNPATVKEGEKATKPSDPSKESYKFLGWLLNGEAYDFNTPVAADITLIADWKEKGVETTYTVSSFGDWYYYYGRTNSQFFNESFDINALTGWTYAKTAIGFGAAGGRELDGTVWNGSLATTIPSGSGPDQRGTLHTWTYFKKTFELPADFDVNTVIDISGIHRIDDALVIFINGIEVYRYNTNNNSREVMGEAINWGIYTGRNTDACNRPFNINSNYNSHDTGFRGTSNPNELFDAASLTNIMNALKPGENVITCVVGQRDGSSSDLWFDLQMSITTETFPVTAADYSAVDEAIAAATALNSSLYADFDAVTAAIAAVIRGLDVTKQAEVDSFAAAINAAIAALTLKAAEYSTVDAAIAAASALNSNLYANFDAVTAAIAAVIRGLDITKQAEVDGFADIINEAIAALVLKDANYSAVEEAIAAANALNSSLYANFDIVTAAIADVVRGLDVTKQAEVDGFAATINSAIAALIYKAANYSAVEEAIAAAEALDGSLYANFDAVTAAIEAVVYGLDITKQADVYGFADAINMAVASLKVKVVLINATPSAFVTKLNGNQNDLTITVTEQYSDGSKKTITITIKIDNNTAGMYKVGGYTVYVDTKGNDQIRELRIVE